MADEPPRGADDAFTLYDLRVEVVAPPGAKLYCGAEVGDHFELRGEMLHLPPGQGISIYSLASVLPLLAAPISRCAGGKSGAPGGSHRKRPAGTGRCGGNSASHREAVGDDPAPR